MLGPLIAGNSHMLLNGRLPLALDTHPRTCHQAALGALRAHAYVKSVTCYVGMKHPKKIISILLVPKVGMYRVIIP